MLTETGGHAPDSWTGASGTRCGRSSGPGVPGDRLRVMNENQRRLCNGEIERLTKEIDGLEKALMPGDSVTEAQIELLKAGLKPWRRLLEEDGDS